MNVVDKIHVLGHDSLHDDGFVAKVQAEMENLTLCSGVLLSQSSHLSDAINERHLLTSFGPAQMINEATRQS